MLTPEESLDAQLKLVRRQILETEQADWPYVMAYLKHLEFLASIRRAEGDLKPPAPPTHHTPAPATNQGPTHFGHFQPDNGDDKVTVQEELALPEGG